VAAVQTQDAAARKQSNGAFFKDLVASVDDFDDVGLDAAVDSLAMTSFDDIDLDGGAGAGAGAGADISPPPAAAPPRTKLPAYSRSDLRSLYFSPQPLLMVALRILDGRLRSSTTTRVTWMS